MRISDWSSDVCSSDLRRAGGNGGGGGDCAFRVGGRLAGRGGGAQMGRAAQLLPRPRAGLWLRSGGAGIFLVRRAGRDRKRVVSGKSVSVRVDLGGRRIIKKKIQ